MWKPHKMHVTVSCSCGDVLFRGEHTQWLKWEIIGLISFLEVERLQLSELHCGVWTYKVPVHNRASSLATQLWSRDSEHSVLTVATSELGSQIWRSVIETPGRRSALQFSLWNSSGSSKFSIIKTNEKEHCRGTGQLERPFLQCWFIFYLWNP